jgi:lysophospholipase L1-like esterase
MRSKKTPKTIVCIGDSQTTQGGTNGKYTDHLQQLLPNHFVINKGISGDTLEAGRKRFKKDILKLHPDIVVIQLGANDYWKMERPVDELQYDLESMVKQCTNKNIKVVIASCFEKDKDTITLLQKNKETNTELQKAKYALAIGKMETEIVKKYNCFYIPNIQVDIKPNTKTEFWTDANHANNLGNGLVAQRILAELKKALRQLSSSSFVFFVSLILK